MISYMAGYSHQPVVKVVGISKSAYFATVYRVINVLLSTDELALKFPNTHKEQDNMATAFGKLGNENLIHGCIGCIDGWLCRIQTPKSYEVGRQQSFFSGHYQHMG